MLTKVDLARLQKCCQHDECASTALKKTLFKYQALTEQEVGIGGRMNYRLLSWVALATFGFTQPSLTWCQESRTETQTIFDGEVIVPGGKDYTATFSVPRGAQNASVSINIAAAGGGGNDITVLVTGVVVGRGHRSRGNRFSFDSGQRPYLNQVVRLPGPG